MRRLVTGALELVAWASGPFRSWGGSERICSFVDFVQLLQVRFFFGGLGGTGRGVFRGGGEGGWGAGGEVDMETAGKGRGGEGVVPARGGQ